AALVGSQRSWARCARGLATLVGTLFHAPKTRPHAEGVPSPPQAAPTRPQPRRYAPWARCARRPATLVGTLFHAPKARPYAEGVPPPPRAAPTRPQPRRYAPWARCARRLATPLA